MTPILYDDTYRGLRYRYGLQYRPVGAGTPAGWVTFSDRPSDDPRCPFGTLDYPRELTPDEVKAFQLVDFGVVGYPCDRCGEQVEDAERWTLSEDGEGHQFRTHERCAEGVTDLCVPCASFDTRAAGAK